MITVVRIVFILGLVYGILKTASDRTPEQALTSVATILICAMALLASFRLGV